MFCTPELVFGSTEGVVSRFHVLCSRTRFRRCRVLQVPFFMFCALRLVFGGTEGVGSRLHILRSRTHFRRYRGRRVLFSCFACPDSFSTVPRASGPVFMFCAPGLVFGGTEGVRSRCDLLRTRTRFWRYRGRRVMFSCFALPNLFSAVPRGFGSRFHVLRSRSRYYVLRSRYRVGGSRFLFLRARNRFRRYRGRWVPFSCFARPDSFSAIARASDPDFMFCAPRLVFAGTEGVGYLFHVFRSWTYFRRYRGRRV
jgi:hypothetical protein